MNKEYEQIKNSGLTGEALLNTLTEFELRNTGHFSSKVDLGGYYLLSGDLERAKDYFRRAEGLKPKAPGDEETRKNICLLYGSLARIGLLQKDYAKANEYVKEAVAFDAVESRKYQFLEGHILIAQNQNAEALEIFDALYRTQAELMNMEDIRAYMYLLADAKRNTECAGIVDLYFEKGRFFSGLGLFASSVYEAAGDGKKAVLAAFLEYEYYSSYNDADDKHFVNNLDALKQQLAAAGKQAETEKVLRLVQSLYDGSAEAAYQPVSSFFAEEYIILKKKIQNRTMNNEDFNKYLILEPYFSQFPVYYWNIWQVVTDSAPLSRPNYLPVLEKIIALDKSGKYARLAWAELSNVMGFGDRDEAN
jgi:hypothetical protein